MIAIVESFIKWLPVWVSTTLIATSIISYIVTYFLTFAYKEPARVLAVMAFALGFYQLGAQEFYAEQKIEIRKEIQYVHDVKVQQVEVTKTVVKWLHDKQQATGNNYVAIENSITTKDDAQCVIPKSFVGVFNAAATNTVPNTTSGTDGTAASTTSDPSGVQLSEAEKVIVANDKTYFDVANQLTALQKWVNDQKTLADKKPPQ